MPLLALLFAATIAIIFLASVLFNAPPQSRTKNISRTSVASEIKYRKTVGF